MSVGTQGKFWEILVFGFHAEWYRHFTNHKMHTIPSTFALKKFNEAYWTDTDIGLCPV